jgi:hypothetical protein
VNEEGDGWPSQLAIGMGALLVVALVAGGVVGLVLLGAANIVGLGGTDAGPAREPTLVMPSPETRSPRAEEPTETTTAPQRPERSPNTGKPRKQRRVITLTASPARAATSERVYLRGRYPGANGTSLQVQRLEGRWVDFPVSVTVRGGRFETYVVSGRAGENRFRVVDESAGRRSAPVSVRLR